MLQAMRRSESDRDSDRRSDAIAAVLFMSALVAFLIWTFLDITGAPGTDPASPSKCFESEKQK
jgi:hypothetical protein